MAKKWFAAQRDSPSACKTQHLVVLDRSCIGKCQSDRITLDHNSFVVFMSSVYESSKIVAHRHMSLLPRLPRLQSSRFEVLVTSLLCVSWRWRLLKQGWAHRGRHAGYWNHVSQHRIRGRLRVWFFKPLISVKCGKPHNKPSQIGVYYCVYIQYTSICLFGIM